MSANPIVCDNCVRPCTAFVEDSSLLLYTVQGERPFRWGIDCECGKIRGWTFLTFPPDRLILTKQQTNPLI